MSINGVGMLAQDVFLGIHGIGMLAQDVLLGTRVGQRINGIPRPG